MHCRMIPVRCSIFVASIRQSFCLFMSSIMRSACKSLLLITSSPSLWMMTHPHPDTSVRVQTDLMSLTQQRQHQLQASPHQEVRPWLSSLFSPSPSSLRPSQATDVAAEVKRKLDKKEKKRKKREKKMQELDENGGTNGDAEVKTARSLLASLHVSIWGRTCNTWSRLSVRHARAAWLRTIGRS